MQRQSVRVVLASEHPQVRNLLSGVIEQEDGVDIVGQAQDAGKALALVKNLRPDIAVIDCYLPHTVGLNATAMARINGLDTAQAIAKEIPSTRVILLSNLNADTLSKGNLDTDNITLISREKTGTSIPVSLQELYQETVPIGAVVFADIEVKQQEILRQKVTSINDRLVFFGALGLAGGWLLTLTMFLLPVGVPLAIAGAAAVVIGLAGKLTASWWRRIKNGTKRG